jgi:hypothetical protein
MDQNDAKRRVQRAIYGLEALLAPEEQVVC